MGCWRGYLSEARCRLVYGPADASASCFSKSFTFLALTHLSTSPGKKAIKHVCVFIVADFGPPMSLLEYSSIPPTLDINLQVVTVDVKLEATLLLPSSEHG